MSDLAAEWRLTMDGRQTAERARPLTPLAWRVGLLATPFGTRVQWHAVNSWHEAICREVKSIVDFDFWSRPMHTDPPVHERCVDCVKLLPMEFRPNIPTSFNGQESFNVAPPRALLDRTVALAPILSIMAHASELGGCTKRQVVFVMVSRFGWTDQFVTKIGVSGPTDQDRCMWSGVGKCPNCVHAEMRTCSPEDSGSHGFINREPCAPCSRWCLVCGVPVEVLA